MDAGRPISHVAAEAGVSRKTLGKWYGRRKEAGEVTPAQVSIFEFL